MAEASQSARLMLPADRGGDIATARGDGAAMHLSVPVPKGSEQRRPLGGAILFALRW
jgi:hypothetical protein